MKWITLLLALLVISCSGGNEPYNLQDTASGLRITFPGYPYTQAYVKQPYRRLIELRKDSVAYFIDITSRSTEARETVVEGSRRELEYQMRQQGFEQSYERDTVLGELPVYEAFYRDDQYLLQHYIIIKDSFVIHPSVLMMSESQLVDAASYFNSLHFVDDTTAAP